jgi:hypothetical protein
MQYFGSNRYGEKKFYKIFHFSEPSRVTFLYLTGAIGFFCGFLALASYYNYKKVNIN